MVVGPLLCGPAPPASRSLRAAAARPAFGRILTLGPLPGLAVRRAGRLGPARLPRPDHHERCRRAVQTAAESRGSTPGGEAELS